MQFSIATEYAVKIMYHLCKNNGDLIKAKEVDELFGISFKSFMKIISKLRNAGLVQSVQGRNGGYYIGDNRELITLYDIVYAIEGKILGDFAGRSYYKSRISLEDEHKLCTFIKELRIEIETKLKSKRLIDFENKPEFPQEHI